MNINYGPTLLSVAWTLTSFATVFVGLRYFCRFKCRQPIGWDEFWVTVTLTLSYAMCIDWTILVNTGGVVENNEILIDSSRMRLITNLCGMFCTAALALSKVAVGSLLLRLQSPSRWRTRTIWTLCGLSVLLGVIQIGLIWSNQDQLIVDENEIASSAYWAFVDIAFAAIPVHMIWNLCLPLRQKIGIGVILSTGAIAAIIAIIRTVKIAENMVQGIPSAFDVVVLLILTCLEVNMLIITACIPTLGPLYHLAHGCGPSYGQRTVPTNHRSLASRSTIRAFHPNHRQIHGGEEFEYIVDSKSVPELASDSADDEERLGNHSIEWTTEAKGWRGDPPGGIQIKQAIEVQSQPIRAARGFYIAR